MGRMGRSESVSFVESFFQGPKLVCFVLLSTRFMPQGFGSWIELLIGRWTMMVRIYTTMIEIAMKEYFNGTFLNDDDILVQVAVECWKFITSRAALTCVNPPFPAEKKRTLLKYEKENHCSKWCLTYCSDCLIFASWNIASTNHWPPTSWTDHRPFPFTIRYVLKGCIVWPFMNIHVFAYLGKMFAFTKWKNDGGGLDEMDIMNQAEAIIHASYPSCAWPIILNRLAN